MKKAIFTILLFTCVSLITWAQCVQKTDSLFKHHLSIIKKIIKSNSEKYGFNGDVNYFLYMIDDITDMNIELQGYTHQPLINKSELIEIENWYLKNREIINNEKVEQLFLLHKAAWTDMTMDIDKMENFNDSIYNKIDSLKQKIFIAP